MKLSFLVLLVAMFAMSCRSMKKESDDMDDSQLNAAKSLPVGLKDAVKLRCTGNGDHPDFGGYSYFQYETGDKLEKTSNGEELKAVLKFGADDYDYNCAVTKTNHLKNKFIFAKCTPAVAGSGIFIYLRHDENSAVKIDGDVYKERPRGELPEYLANLDCKKK